MVNDRLKAKNALLSSHKRDQELDEKLLMAKALRLKLVSEAEVYDQTKEIETRVIRQLDFPKGFLGNLTRLTGAGIVTKDYNSPLEKSVNDAFTEDWKRIGRDMKVVIRRNSQKFLKDNG